MLTKVSIHSVFGPQFRRSAEWIPRFAGMTLCGAPVGIEKMTLRYANTMRIGSSRSRTYMAARFNCLA